MSAVELVRRFADAFVHGRLDELPLTDDCVDANPVPLQPPGRDGVIWKLALFRAQFSGFVSAFVGLIDRGDTVTAIWTTQFPTGALTHWRGTFTIAGAAITRFEVQHVG
jgi:hypothetical protein